MGSYCEDEEDDDFFDAHEVFASMSDDCSTSGFGYDYWIGNLDSTTEARRGKFLRFMDLNSRWLSISDEEMEFEYDFVDEIRERSEYASTQNPHFEDESLRRQPSLSDWPNTAMELLPSGTVNEHQNRHFQDGLIDEKGNCGSSSKGSSCRGCETISLLNRRKKVKKGWLQKLNIMARITDRHEESVTLRSTHTNSKGDTFICSVHVHTHKKKLRELSSIYATQEFPAHTGSISIMKFSHDGRYLASAGEDSILRIWEVFEDQDPKIYKIQGTDHSSFYFSTNHLSKLAPLKMDKDKPRRKSSELSCVILPPKAFRILEKPIHEFHGHAGDILSLSWSKKGHLLSSSIDKTVRMWKVGQDECLKRFPHYNYVTCVEFNPMDDNYFISGSIDGKVRIWDMDSCQVITWIDLGDIVTAVCYNPDGKGSIVGTLDGKCSFYDIIDDRLQLHTQICLLTKKKWPKRITGFQFCPMDSKKVIVSSADSQVRILCGINLIGKFKGNRSSGSHMSACFTSDGKHIISTAEDSNIYVWNHVSTDKLSTKPKRCSSSEYFWSQNTKMAIPWCGIKTISASLPSPRFTLNNNNNNNVVLPKSTTDYAKTAFPSTNRGFFLESLLKGHPTWPAESLPDSTQVCVSPSMRKSEYKFLKSAYRVAPNMWGLVIVAAGWDGRIRTYLNYGLPIRLRP